MKQKIRNKIIFVVCLFLICMAGMPVHATEQIQGEKRDEQDLKPLELCLIDESYDNLDESAMNICDGDEGTAYSGVYRTNWDLYGNDYCYQNLRSTWQDLYDEMNLYCTLYMNTRIDAKTLSVDGRSVYGIGPISYEGLTAEELASLVYIFTYQNPQFYFVKNSLYYNTKVLYLGVYDYFSDGDTRSDTSVQMYKQIDAWVQEIGTETTTYAKEKKAHDIICDHVVYETGTYDQSAYSAVLQKKTVCAGYTKLYSVLTNASGLETVSITSPTHGWNRTKIGERWYNVDLTWDDGTPVVYTFFNKSDATMKKYDGSARESHTQNNYYDGIAPGCETDYGTSTVVVDAERIETGNPSIELDLANNTKKKISTSFVPEDVTDKRLGYISANTKIASVDASGVVTAVSPGKTSITVRKLTNNRKTTCIVEVYGKMNAPEVPTIAESGTTYITLGSQNGCLYSMDGKTWQSSPKFSNLKPNTTYTFYVKRPSQGYYRESRIVSVTVQTLAEESKNLSEVTVQYRTHVQTYGWQDFVLNGVMSGTSGKAKRLEGIEILVTGDHKLGIQYTTHCQTYGWLPWSANGELNGTQGEAKRLEAIKIQLTGADKDKYDVYYRVHAQSYGWLGWAKNGNPAGTAGYAKRLEGIQIVVLKKGEKAPGDNYKNIDAKKAVHRTESYIAKPGVSPVVGSAATSNQSPNISGEECVNVTYRTHVQTYGWQGWKYNGQMSGTSGKAKRLEGIEIRLTNKPYNGSVVYTTHIQSYGWQGNMNNMSTWKRDGEMSGTSGKAKRLEAICIDLTGEMKEHYDIYYRVHAQSYGWLSWAKNGAPAGTAGFSKRLEGIQIVLVPKGGQAPSNQYQDIQSRWKQVYIKR